MLKNRNLKRQSNIKRVFLALLLIVLTFSLLHALAEPGTVVTSGGRLNMRQSPDDKARIVTKIKNGKTVEVLDLADGWYHITYEGYEGYVKEQYIKLLSAAIGQEIYSNGMTLYLRESMDATSRIVGMVNSQQTMKVEQIDDGWILVSSGVVKGYVRTEEIDQLNEEPAAVATQKWTEGILQKETTLYRDPDKNSEVLSTWPKGQGVSVCPYNKDWSLIQIQDENICGFARKASVSLSPLPTVQPDKQVVDESQYISSSKAKSIAEKALKKYTGFNAKRWFAVRILHFRQMGFEVRCSVSIIQTSRGSMFTQPMYMHIPAKCCIPATSLDLQANTILPICGHLHPKQHRIHNGGMMKTGMSSGIGRRSRKQELISEKIQRGLLQIDISQGNIPDFHK